MAYIYLPPTKKKINQDKKEANLIYNSQRWKRLRALKISIDPLCEDCLALERIAPAVEVHHITPFMSGLTPQQRRALAYDFTNLRSLCLDCHHSKHKTQKGD